MKLFLYEVLLVTWEEIRNSDDEIDKVDGKIRSKVSCVERRMACKKQPIGKFMSKALQTRLCFFTLCRLFTEKSSGLLSDLLIFIPANSK